MTLLIGIYFVPTIVALILRVRQDQGGVFCATNLIAGWTLIGWLMALGLVCVYQGLDRLEDPVNAAYAVQQWNENRNYEQRRIAIRRMTALENEIRQSPERAGRDENQICRSRFRQLMDRDKKKPKT